MKTPTWTRFCAAALLAGMTQQSLATEGAWSHYLPGTYGDFEVGVVGEESWHLRNDLVYFDGNLDRIVLQGRINERLNLKTIINVLSASYWTNCEFYGARYGFGVRVPFYAGELETYIADNAAVFQRNEVDHTAFGDVYFIPLMLNWTLGEDMHLTLYEGISAPTGSYSINDLYPIGRNYWSFDTNVAFTWFIPEYSLDVSFTMGYLVNTKNDDTNYKSGGEFHFDYNVGYRVNDKFAVGVTGIFYDQVTGDNRPGALLGRVEASSIGVGPSLKFSSDLGHFEPLDVIFKLIYETDTENRYKGKYWTLGLQTKL